MTFDAPGRRPTLARRILLLLVPGIACIALGIGGLLLIHALDDDEEDKNRRSCQGSECRPSPTSQSPAPEPGVVVAAVRGLAPGGPLTVTVALDGR